MDDDNFDDEDEKILWISFNQDFSCFLIGTESGYKIFNSYKFSLLTDKDLGGGIGIVEMLGQTNILGLVGGGKNPKFSEKLLTIWNDKELKIISELNFKSKILNIKLKLEQIFIILINQIFVFNLKYINNPPEIFSTYDNPLGLFVISPHSYHNVIAYPDKDFGYIRIRCYEDPNILEAKYIECYKKDVLGCLGINLMGTLIAVASSKGNTIKIVVRENNCIVLVLRRGLDRANIFSLNFDIKSKFICVGSDTGIVNIYSLSSLYVEDERTKNLIKNKNSYFKNVAKFFGLKNSYFDEEWGFSQIDTKELKMKCCFRSGTDDHIIIIGEDWKYYECEFDKEKGGNGKINIEINIWEKLEEERNDEAEEEEKKENDKK
jgi:WD40 repeat protein